jgi:hypothetical protein
MQKMLRGESSYYNLEKRYIRKNGGSVWVFVNASVVYGQEKNPLYLIIQVEDISVRKATEESLLNEHIHLQKEMQDNTEALKAKIAELERFRKATVEREFRIHELIDELDKLKAEKTHTNP